jgi:hypothetical protein
MTDDGESAVRRLNDIRDVVRPIAVAVLSSEHRLHGGRDIRLASSGDVAAPATGPGTARSPRISPLGKFMV